MLITLEEINKILSDNKIRINGCFHVGAHNCEEMELYNKLGIEKNNIIWIDAIESKVNEMKQKGIVNIYNALITDKDDNKITFNISNNCQSSSVLEFGTHKREHPEVIYVDKITMNSITVDTFFERNKINQSKYDFWNFDIQGAELMALKGSIKSIKYAKVIYLEVNQNELYKNCALIDEIDNFLLQYNFNRVLTKMTHHGWGDAIYILDSKVQIIDYSQFNSIN